MVAQALQQADTDVAIEAWAVRDAEPRDLAQLMAEVFYSPPHAPPVAMMRLVINAMQQESA